MKQIYFFPTELLCSRHLKLCCVKRWQKSSFSQQFVSSFCSLNVFAVCLYFRRILLQFVWESNSQWLTNLLFFLFLLTWFFISHSYSTTTRLYRKKKACSIKSKKSTSSRTKTICLEETIWRRIGSDRKTLRERRTGKTAKVSLNQRQVGDKNKQTNNNEDYSNKKMQSKRRRIGSKFKSTLRGVKNRN